MIYSQSADPVPAVMSNQNLQQQGHVIVIITVLQKTS